ncbi:MAG TPA: HPF/RaiA family ribosome-associated protein [Pseudolabrys sp.]|nr:HPF/RaiA family ribosome-associated protein [Pseudolabrys sp.]
MNIEPEISFHKFEGSDELKGDIRNHIDRLEQYFGRMTTCRVRVDQRQQNAAGSIPPVVSIEVSIPGRKDVIVSHEPGHLQRKFQTPDVNNAVSEAFRIAQQRLAQVKDKMSDHRQAVVHEASHELKGQVAEMHPEQDYGYVMTAAGGLLYFHRNSVLSGDFDALQRGAAVSYVEGSGDTGPTASKVRVV